MKYYDCLESIKKFNKKVKIEKFTPIIKEVWKESQIEEFECINNGRINSIYRLTLSNASVKSVILKVRYMDDERYKQGFACENWVNELLEKENISITPRIYASDDTRKKIDMDYSILEEIEQHRSQTWGAKHFFEAGKILAQIHKIKVDYYGKNHNNINDNTYNFYNTYFHSILEGIKEKNKELYDIAKNIVLKYYKAEKYKNLTPVLLHHDYHKNNIIIDKDNNLKIIDWDSARGGIAEVDFLKIKHLSFRNEKSENIEKFLEGYKSIKELPLTSNFPVQEIIWLCKMYSFEKDWKTGRDESYYPNEKYYEEQIIKSSKKIGQISNLKYNSYIWQEI